MSDHLAKVRHILPHHLFLAFLTIVSYALLRWVLDLRTGWLVLDEELWDIWLPMAVPWVVVLLWSRPRTRVLTFKHDDDRGRFLVQAICAFSIGGAVIASQYLLKETAGGLVELASVRELDPAMHARHYRLKRFVVASWHGGSHGSAHTSGRYNERLNYELFFVAPLLVDSADALPDAPVVWYGVKFHEELSNRASDAEKERAWKDFGDRSLAAMENYEYHELDHFVRVPPSEDRKAYLEAIASRTGEVTDREVVLVPEKAVYGEGSLRKLGWVLAILGIGALVLLAVLLWARLDRAELDRQRSGRPTVMQEESVREWLGWFVPVRGRIVTTALVDLNLLVFIAMVLSGVHLISPRTADLVQWGANTTVLTPNGEAWRLFTCLFVHGGLMHVLMNCFGLVLAGMLLEPMIGSARYAVLYLVCGCIAALTSLWWHDDVISVGASGAVFGLFGALLGILLLQRRMDLGERQGLLTFVGIYIGGNLVYGMIGGIDNAAHVGGLMVGLILGPTMYFTHKGRMMLQ